MLCKPRCPIHKLLRQVTMQSEGAAMASDQESEARFRQVIKFVCARYAVQSCVQGQVETNDVGCWVDLVLRCGDYEVEVARVMPGPADVHDLTTLV